MYTSDNQNKLFLHVTNNQIRKFLYMPESSSEIHVKQVDSINSLSSNTLYFVNDPSIYLPELDSLCEDSVFLVSTECPKSSRNDFIRVENPKFKFCHIVERFKIPSSFQRNCKEIIIGKDCQLDEGVILGGVDFSPVQGSSRDQLVQFPQMGGVCLGDRVVVKYHSMIGKGTFGYTKIGDNTMIDYGCQIGHNCLIGDACIIAAGTIIGGSTIIGSNTTIGIGATIRNGIKIGKNVSIGMGSVVIRDIPDYSTVVGNPARIIDHKPIFDEGGLV